ncbi:MAG: insulinase family protein [Deltaproteobacteria bacterium]
MSRVRSAAIAASAAFAFACGGRSTLPPLAQPLTPTPDEPFRATPPPVETDARPLVAPEVDARILDNGLTVWVARRESHDAFVYLVNREGGRRFAKEPDAATLAARVLAARIDGKAGVASESAYVRKRGDPIQVPYVFERLMTALSAGPVEGSRLRSERTQLHNEAGFTSSSNAAWLVDRMERGGPDHPLAQVPRVRTDALTNVSGADVTVFIEGAYRPEACAVIVVGPVDAATIHARAAEAFAAWRSREAVKASAPIGRLPSEGGRRIRFVPGRRTQAYVGLLLDGPSVQSTEAIDYEVMVAALSNGFVSRAQSRLRHDRGLTYGVYTQRRARTGNVRAMLGGWFDHDGAAQGAQGLLDVVDDLQKRPLDAAELDNAKARLRASLHARLASTRGVAGYLRDVFAQELPPTYANAIEARLSDVTAADVTKAARAALVPEQARLVVLGLEPEFVAALSSIGTLVRTPLPVRSHRPTYYGR